MGCAMRDRVGIAAAVAGRAALAAAALVALAAPAAAQQDVSSVAGTCAAGTVGFQEPCLEAALAAEAAHAGPGLLASGGTQVPGAASTIGRRFDGTPRFSFSLRGSAVRGRAPEMTSPGSADTESYLAFATQAELALGLLDGFSLLPTLGGVLSLDAFVAGSLLALPGGSGFGGNRFAYGGGARLGLLRESFTLPGVTVSVAHRWMGDVSLGDVAAGDAREVLVDPTVTSLRGVVGKDLLAVGVLAGVGWDRYESDGTLTVAYPLGIPRETRFEALRSERRLYFGGLSLSLLILQLSVEGGWAEGFDRVPSGRSPEAYDAGEGTPFFALAGRLTL